MKKQLLLLLCMLCAVTGVRAQSLWTSAEFKAGLTKRLAASLEGEYRTHDGMSSTERWAGTLGLDYKAFKFLKVSAGYTYIYQHTETETTNKGNIIPPYWQPKHRATFALTGSYSFNRLELSLRECYQYTYRPEQSVAKYDDDGVTRKADELVNAKHKHILRSRLQAEYNIANCHFSPFVSGELYNKLSSFDLEKTRWTAGVDYKFNKHHSINAFYRYINHDDDDEESGHVIGIGYAFKL